ncbi:TetR/AcrR family transcriptional regulator [Rhodococcus qingshengii]|uniref:TetR/AcrR family transcriptional regulator n=1 Tax=Rhodococcus qingshengii TaxID=334542 RepID=A0AAW6LQP7_RHOSG|nr:TetR/AcrR family transcriptional regulator [Rhodococcus qingshengii]MDE8647587.1 TetR/AcrR family transcriptional regulator [Rhodococcus qingshengii]
MRTATPASPAVTFGIAPCVQPRAKVTRDKVLSETAQVFDTLGFFPASITEMVAGSDLTKGAIFYHFPSKEAIAQQIVEDWTAVIEAEFSHASATAAPAEAQLTAVFKSLAATVATSVRARAGMKLTVEKAVGGGAAAYRKWVDATDAVFSTALGTAGSPTAISSRRRASSLCAGFIGVVLLDELEGDDLDIATRVDDLLAMHLAFAR